MMMNFLTPSLKIVPDRSDHARYIQAVVRSRHLSLSLPGPDTTHRLCRCHGPTPLPGLAHSNNVVMSLVLHLAQDDLWIY